MTFKLSVKLCIKLEQQEMIKMETVEKTAPKCPECGQPMETLYYEQSGAVIFDSGSGCYVDGGQFTEVVRCPNCGKVIGVWRPDGRGWGFKPEMM
jgi:uncharacterized protein with PIN domain